MKYWIEERWGNHDGRFDIICPKCSFQQTIRPTKGELLPNFCPTCGEKLHSRNQKDLQEEKNAWIKEHWGNHDGRYDIKCPKCNFKQEIHPSIGERAPNFCPKCGKNMS